MNTIDFASLPTFFLTTCFIFLGVFGRYVATAVVFSYVVGNAFKSQFTAREVQIRPRRDGQDWVEIGWSFVTSILFALSGSGMLVAWQKGYTLLYTQWDAYPLAWFGISLLLVLFLHETYYYWLHRWMHRPKIYRYVHKVHHDSITTSAWTSFSFHPIESLLQALIIPFLTFIIPLHVVAIGLLLTLMTLTSVINHLNTELYPSGANRHWFGKWWIGATHHSLHHTQFRYNFGLYFTCWDKWMKTESPEFHRLFDQKTQKASVEKVGVEIHQKNLLGSPGDSRV